MIVNKALANLLNVVLSQVALSYWPARSSQLATQLMRLATHYRDTWVRRLRTPALMRLPLGDRFLMDYYPRPLEGGAASPTVRHEPPPPPGAPPKSVSLQDGHKLKGGRAMNLHCKLRKLL